LKGVLRGFTENQASTDVHGEDLRLRGRTYAIPFEAVWQASIGLCGGELRGWSIERADDQRGVISAHVSGGLASSEVMVKINIGLDANAQTRVDLTATSSTERGDFGRSGRLIARFVRRLDEKLQARPDQIWDPRELTLFENAS
jgi:hypothetical protein